MRNPIKSFLEKVKYGKFIKQNKQMYDFYTNRIYHACVDLKQEGGYLPGDIKEGDLVKEAWRGLLVTFRCICVHRNKSGIKPGHITSIDFILHSILDFKPINTLTFEQFLEEYGHLKNNLVW